MNSFNNFFKVLFVTLCQALLLSASFAQATPDPGIPGPFAVTKTEYNLGDLAFKPPSYPDTVEVRGSVFYPTSLTGGPFPVIVFLHGRHDVCYETANPSNLQSVWPCPSGWQPILSYEGYDYLAKAMASHGYFVISISCNAINATDNAVGDYGMQGRAELLQHHLDLWNTWNTVGGGPFGSLFVGMLNMQNVGTMGHSRGGEGVIYNALYNQSLGSPYGIKAIITLAPTDFNRHVLHGIPVFNVAPYCDGDVSNLMGVHFYDDARYTDTSDIAPKHSILYMGANHNYFNTVWTPGSYIAGGIDDWLYGYSSTDPQCGAATVPTMRFDSTKQKNALLPYLCAFYRVYMGHEYQFTPILNVDDVNPPPTSTLDTNEVYMSFHPSKINRMDVNRTDSSVRLTTDNLNAGVSGYGLVVGAICGGGGMMPSCNISPNGNQEPHKGTLSTPGLGAMNLQWNSNADYYENQIPLGMQDLRRYQDIIFRATVNYNLSVFGERVNYSVQLTDAAGNTATRPVGNYTHAMFYQPGTQGGDLPKAMFNTIKLPLDKFTGINKAQITNVKFLFNKSVNGAILVSDLAFSTKPCKSYTDTFTYTVLANKTVSFTNYSVAGQDDSLIFNWNFGDIPSGGNNVSAVASPAPHVYSHYGYFTACLYVTSYQKSGFVCTDTFCRNIVLSASGVLPIEAENIDIAPNPAKNYLTISGAASVDGIVIKNLLGETVLQQTVGNGTVYLPANLANGIYIVEITAAGGRLVRKIVVEH
jgi:Secretion system C-terminal sorting domain